MSRLRSLRTSIGSGVLGQGLSVGASVLPILFGRTESLIFSVQVTAPVAVMVYTVTLAASFQLPSIVNEEVAERYRSIASIVLLVCSAVTTASGFALWITTSRSTLALVIFFAGIVLFCQGRFVLSLATLVRLEDVGRIMRARLVYGATLFGLTLTVSIAGDYEILLVCSTAIALAVASYYGSFHAKRTGLQRSHAAPPSEELTLSKIIRRSLVLAFSQLIGGVSSQAGAFAVSFVGDLAVGWAVVFRVTAGFQTIGFQLLGPRIDSGFAASVRSNNMLAARQLASRGLAVSTTLGLTSAATAVISIIWINQEGDLPKESIQSLLMAGSAYTFGSVALAPIGRLLGLVGSARTRLYWEAGRLLFTVGSLIALADVQLIYALAIIAVAAFAAYLPLIYIATSRTARHRRSSRGRREK